MGKWIYVKDEEEIAEEEMSLVYDRTLEPIDDSQDIPDDAYWHEEGDPENEDDCVANGWDLPS
jgi:hypothetical protein